MHKKFQHNKLQFFDNEIHLSIPFSLGMPSLLLGFFVEIKLIQIFRQSAIL